MKKYLNFITIFLFFCTALQSAASKTNWKITKRKNGIINYIAPIKGSKYNQYKAAGIINARAETIIALLRDVPAYKEWIHSCINIKLIKDFGNDKMIIYYVHDTMSPGSDRDSVAKTRSAFDLDKGKAAVFIDSIKYTAFPLNKEYVEMDFHVKFYAAYIDREHTKIVFTIKIDPGNNLSAFLLDFDSKNLPIKTLLKMRQMVKKQKYIAGGKKIKELPLIEKYYKKVGK